MTSAHGSAVDGFIDALLDDDPERLYQRAPCGYLSTTPDGTIVKANETFLALTGFHRDDVVGRKHFAELLAPGGRIYHETHFAPMLRMHGSAREIALDLVRRDGTRLPVLVNAVLEHDAAGVPTVIRLAVFDATHRREYERELLRERDRAEASEGRALALARTLQQTLIPPTPPQVPGLDVAAAFHPAGDGAEVGGDFYDVFPAGVDDWVVVIGDVCGKGPEAAVITALMRYTLRAAVVQSPSPSAALHTANDVLLGYDTERFCTAVVVRLQRTGSTWQASMSNAGHPLALRIRAEDNSVGSVGGLGTLLGVLNEISAPETTVELQAEDILVLYTDGVSEGRADDEFYGDERIAEILARGYSTAASCVTALSDDVVAFQRGRPRDDIAVVAVRVPRMS